MSMTTAMDSSTAKKSEQKVWFITGASSGFGKLLAQELLKRGDAVVATARKPDALLDLMYADPANLQVIQLDVTSEAAIKGAVEDALARFGRIDVLVNNAGYGVIGAIEEVTRDEFMPMFETNVFGLAAMTKAVLPHMRERRSGTIVNLSSIAGLIATPGFGYYAATKFAVEAISESLRAEVEPLGIKVTVIEPGPFRTDFLGRSAKEAKEILPDYIPTAGKGREYNQTQAGKQPGDPQKAVEAIILAVEAPEQAKMLLLGKSALTRYRTKLATVAKELDTWETVTVGADFPEGK